LSDQKDRGGWKGKRETSRRVRLARGPDGSEEHEERNTNSPNQNGVARNGKGVGTDKALLSQSLWSVQMRNKGKNSKKEMERGTPTRTEASDAGEGGSGQQKSQMRMVRFERFNIPNTHGQKQTEVKRTEGRSVSKHKSTRKAVCSGGLGR